MEYEAQPLAILSEGSNDEDSHSEEETSLNTLSILKLANMEYEAQPLAILSEGSNDEDSHSEEETSLNTLSILKLGN
ncbi:Hypothetical predicted protein [Mytilus galloprovincialis]|uniref:Uncharacterized protein n=1 Tax=Mytilus galloprovincialis TaxID=29158 RepID=A0A8B6FXV8_MYTGA|nr:Hypothetical predicted protein [Mytilus galloprovincialis]